LFLPGFDPMLGTQLYPMAFKLQLGDQLAHPQALT
jgi:hypothetical protein